MRIKKLSLRNYRTFENLDLEFPDFYTAVCGQNDAGKSNVIRALQVLLGPDDPIFRRRGFRDLTHATDYPKWLVEAQGAICISCELVIHKEYDAGLYSFINEWLELHATDTEVLLTASATATEKGASTEFEIAVGSSNFKGLKAQEVQKRLRSILLIHNSTEAGYTYNLIGELGEFSAEYGRELSQIGKSASKSLKKVAKVHKEEISNLLGRLNRKFKVEITLPNISLNHLPYDLTLGDSKIDVGLSEWGSGTKNRTMIFLALLKARQISKSETTSSKITPVLVIEEPESFLHPAAQAEFGRILQDLSSEFRVQVISTTHSPFMLSKDRPTSNILLERKVYRGQYRGSNQVSTEGEKWMEPFSQILGLSSEEFKPWKDLFFGNSESVLLVEGETDKEYFEMLRSEEHGGKRLKIEAVIFPYDGSGSLSNATLLKFIQRRSRATYITYDLDVEKEVKSKLEGNGFVHGDDFYGLGHDQPGMRNIEGLLPQDFVASVGAANPELVREALYGTKDEQKTAKGKLKRLYLERFKEQSSPNDRWFGEFYKVVKIINEAFARKR